MYKSIVTIEVNRRLKAVGQPKNFFTIHYLLAYNLLLVIIDLYLIQAIMFVTSNFLKHFTTFCIFLQSWSESDRDTRGL